MSFHRLSTVDSVHLACTSILCHLDSFDLTIIIKLIRWYLDFEIYWNINWYYVSFQWDILYNLNEFYIEASIETMILIYLISLFNIVYSVTSRLNEPLCLRSNVFHTSRRQACISRKRTLKACQRQAHIHRLFAVRRAPHGATWGIHSVALFAVDGEKSMCVR